MKTKYKGKGSIKFLHLLDHDGAIFQLISPLETYGEHKVLTSFSCKNKKLEDFLDNYDSRKTIIILHTTLNKNIILIHKKQQKSFYSIIEEILKRFKKVYLFIHVSPRYLKIKGRIRELSNLKKLIKEYSFKILVPSIEVKREFLNYGLRSIKVQIGINPVCIKSLRKEDYKKNKRDIVSVCTSEENIYSYIKGIDKFSKLIKETNLYKRGIILGVKRNFYLGVPSKRIPLRGFIDYLRKSSVYIQLSRMESYNLSAVYAKRLKIPIIVSNIGGHIDNVKYGFRVNNLKEAKKYLKNIIKQDASIQKVVEKNYEDSIKRESLDNFRASFSSLA